MEIKLSNCFLTVDDHELAVAFYRDVLGFEVRNDVKFEGMRWTTVGSPSQPEVNIVLQPPITNPNSSPDDKQALADLTTKGLFGLVFTTDDVDATFERIQSSGAEVLQEPTDQFYGMRDCAFRDPSGNMVRIGQAKK
jgi:uncharacterized glyoxalase superfamily protein PhnB